MVLHEAVHNLFADTFRTTDRESTSRLIAVRRDCMLALQEVRDKARRVFTLCMGVGDSSAAPGSEAAPQERCICDKKTRDNQRSEAYGKYRKNMDLTDAKMEQVKHRVEERNNGAA